jgi:hypothetical protein
MAALFTDRHDKQTFHHLMNIALLAKGLEGSRFGSCPAALANFVATLIPPKRGKKQAAPGNYRTECFVPSCRSGVLDPLEALINLSRVETFPRAAYLTPYSACLTSKENLTRSSGTCQSGLPDVASGSLDDQAKSGSPPGLRRPTRDVHQMGRSRLVIFPYCARSFL